MNKKMRALAAGIALTLSLGLLAGCGGEKKAADNSKKVVNVGIVQLVEHDALDAANKGFIAGMAAKGFKENENVKYDGRMRRQISLTCRISHSVLSAIK